MRLKGISDLSLRRIFGRIFVSGKPDGWLPDPNQELDAGKYLKEEREQCPYCGNYDLWLQSWEDTGSQATSHYACSDCSMAFDEVLELVPKGMSPPEAWDYPDEEYHEAFRNRETTE